MELKPMENSHLQLILLHAAAMEQKQAIEAMGKASGDTEEMRRLALSIRYVDSELLLQTVRTAWCLAKQPREHQMSATETAFEQALAGMIPLLWTCDGAMMEWTSLGLGIARSMEVVHPAAMESALLLSQLRLLSSL